MDGENKMNGKRWCGRGIECGGKMLWARLFCDSSPIDAETKTIRHNELGYAHRASFSYKGGAISLEAGTFSNSHAVSTSDPIPSLIFFLCSDPLLNSDIASLFIVQSIPIRHCFS